MFLSRRESAAVLRGFSGAAALNSQFLLSLISRLPPKIYSTYPESFFFFSVRRSYRLPPKNPCDSPLFSELPCQCGWTGKQREKKAQAFTGLAHKLTAPLPLFTRQPGADATGPEMRVAPFDSNGYAGNKPPIPFHTAFNILRPENGSIHGDGAIEFVGESKRQSRRDG